MKSVCTTLLFTLVFTVPAEVRAFASSGPAACENNALNAETAANDKFNNKCSQATGVRKDTDADGGETTTVEALDGERRVNDGTLEKTATFAGIDMLLMAQLERNKQQEIAPLSNTSTSGSRNDGDKACPNCPEMIPIPGNKFAIAKYTVTFDQWDACVADGGCGGYQPSDNGWGRGSRPVINVNWNDAQAYIRWISGKTGKTYRLPTQEEWKIAALAGSTTDYYWGNDVGRNNANCDGCGSEWDNRRTAPVGSFAPNAFGLYDMMGNVWQWTDTCRQDNCTKRMIAGGSWNHRPQDMRASARNWFDTSKRMRYLGFRLAATLP